MIRQIQPKELLALQQAGTPLLLLDVRGEDEHAYCALPDSTLIPLPELASRIDEIAPTESLVVVYCHHGVRSLSGAAILQQAGFAQVASLAGGIERWSLTVDAAVPRY